MTLQGERWDACLGLVLVEAPVTLATALASSNVIGTALELAARLQKGDAQDAAKVRPRFLPKTFSPAQITAAFMQPFNALTREQPAPGRVCSNMLNSRHERQLPCILFLTGQNAERAYQRLPAGDGGWFAYSCRRCCGNQCPQQPATRVAGGSRTAGQLDLGEVR